MIAVADISRHEFSQTTSQQTELVFPFAGFKLDSALEFWCRGWSELPRTCHSRVLHFVFRFWHVSTVGPDSIYVSLLRPTQQGLDSGACFLFDPLRVKIRKRHSASSIVPNLNRQTSKDRSLLSLFSDLPRYEVVLFTRPLCCPRNSSMRPMIW